MNWIEKKKGYENWVTCDCLCKVLYICKPKTMVEKESTIWNNSNIKFNSMQFYFFIFRKEHNSEHCEFWIISGLTFFHHGHFSFQFNLIQFNSILFWSILIKRICLITWSILNYFRSKYFLLPWSWFIFFSLFNYTFSFQFNSI